MSVYICQKHGCHKDTKVMLVPMLQVIRHRRQEANIHTPELVGMVGNCNRNGVFAIRLTWERPVSGQSVEGTFVASLCAVCPVPFCG